MLSFDSASFDYEPYPICYMADVLGEGLYAQMCASYPPADLFLYKPNLGHKYSLSEINNPAAYHDFIAGNPLWRDFHAYVKAPAFIRDIWAFLAAHNIDLGAADAPVATKKAPLSFLRQPERPQPSLSARFEFSMMSPEGGHIRPHTDGPDKLVTLVISMMPENEWDERWGGATQVCLPKDRTRIYNQLNRYMDFQDVDVVKTFPFVPNQCVLFIKTYNSWHQVAPIKGETGAPMRKTLTINIERKA